MNWLLIPTSYLIGSMPWGLLVVRATTKVDVRTTGSGKTGATNVLRAAGKWAALVVLLADFGKGLGVVLLARWVTDDPTLQAATASAVIAGHVWPVLAGFRGGRGIATGFGATVGIDPIAAVVALLVFVPAVGATRYVSLGSVLSVLAAVAAMGVRAAFLGAPVPYVGYGIICGTLIVYMHRDNIRRLARGTERRLGTHAK
jgi:glycerol-3-phosphate acyltransferase PlsY